MKKLFLLLLIGLVACAPEPEVQPMAVRYRAFCNTGLMDVYFLNEFGYVEQAMGAAYQWDHAVVTEVRTHYVYVKAANPDGHVWLEVYRNGELYGEYPEGNRTKVNEIELWIP